MYQKFVAKFNNISFTIILGVCALIPFFFLPSAISGLGAVKGAFLYIGVLLAFSFWLVAQFIDGALKIPKHTGMLALFAWAALALVSALTSANVNISLWGRGFVIDSFATVLVLSLFVFLVASFARDQRKLIKLFLAAFSGSVLTIILQVILYISSSAPFVADNFGHIAAQGTLVGSWVDFAYFTTFTFILSLLMYEVLMPKGFFKILSFVAMILSVIVLIFLNFKAAWIITIISALLVFVYKFSVERAIISRREIEGDEAPQEQQRFPLMSFIALLAGLFFLLSSSSIGAIVSNYAGISFTDIRPSFETSNKIMGATFASDPVFGAGAGRYADMWNLHRSADVNNTIFWNVPFESGYSLFQTLVTTNGVLVGLALVILLVIVLLSGFKLFNYKFPDRFSRFIAVTALIMFIAFVGLVLLASPGIVLIAMGFMYMGLLLGVSALIGKTKVASIQYLKDPRMSFFAILGLVVLTMIGFAAVFFSATKFASILSYNQALRSNNFETAVTKIDKAIMLSKNDIYWRTRAALFTSQFTAQSQSQNADTNMLQTYFSQAEQSALAAVSWDRNSAANWLTLSQVYLLGAGGSPEAYANAKQAADEVQSRNPNNPVTLLNQAQIALANKDTTGALNYADQAIALKSDYIDAYSFKSGVKRSLGDTAGARAELARYTSAMPFDPQGHVLVGLLHVNQKEYQLALEAFKKARDLRPNDPNLYLQYINVLKLMGDRSEAVRELRAFKERFPSITGVDEEIVRVQSGASVQTPAPTTEETSVEE